MLIPNSSKLQLNVYIEWKMDFPCTGGCQGTGGFADTAGDGTGGNLRLSSEES